MKHHQTERLLQVIWRLNRNIFILQDEANDLAENLRVSPLGGVDYRADNCNSLIHEVLSK